mmetsp:Transcript_30316/g.51818  ORF Transcript_30316/g.51818 Transcript_30316/m.51818 type:complete len:202 (-) Transcript_30316:2457-3062(-)
MRRVADRSGVAAEVNLGEQRVAAAVGCLLACKVVELAEIAHACRLDGTSPPPAAPFDVASRFPAHFELRPAAILAATGAGLPASGAVVVHVHAALACHQAGLAGTLVVRVLDVVEVRRVLGEHLLGNVARRIARAVVDLAARHRVERRREMLVLVPLDALSRAPAGDVPTRGLWYNLLRRAEERRRGAVPLGVRLRGQHHR